MKAQTLADAVKELEGLRHARAVWMEVVEHLSRFLDQEVRVADEGIAAEGCVEDRVPQPVIREFIKYINDENIEPLNEQIDSIENLTVVETNSEKDQSSGKPVAAEANKGSKAGNPRKKIRSVAGNN